MSLLHCLRDIASCITVIPEQTGDQDINYFIHWYFIPSGIVTSLSDIRLRLTEEFTFAVLIHCCGLLGEAPLQEVQICNRL